MISAKLFIGDLSPDITPADLRAFLREAGVRESCPLTIYRYINRSKGFAFVEMNSVEAAVAAKEKLSGKYLRGLTLQVSHISPKQVSLNLTAYS